MFNAHECKIVFSAVRPVIIEMGNLPVLLRQVAFEMKTQRASATALVENLELDVRGRGLARLFCHVARRVQRMLSFTRFGVIPPEFSGLSPLAIERLTARVIFLV
jgi:hypothetical protein